MLEILTMVYRVYKGYWLSMNTHTIVPHDDVYEIISYHISYVNIYIYIDSFYIVCCISYLFSFLSICHLNSQSSPIIDGVVGVARMADLGQWPHH